VSESLPGALVISLDFELHWGLRERGLDAAAVRERVGGARRVVPMLLDLFEEFEVAATWATVGFLFAADREEARRHAPATRPNYLNPELDAYREPLGEDEVADPLHFAASLVDRIRATPRQEIATHTFSHYYCNEPGQDAAAFAADLGAAVSIAALRGVQLRSIVFPRNQHNPDYDALLTGAGLLAYRGLPASWAWRFRTARESAAPVRRAARLLDAYIDVGVGKPQSWATVRQPSGLANVAATTMLRAITRSRDPLQRLRLQRLVHGMTEAARSRQIFHIWWHPHNFGLLPEENLAFVRELLRHFETLRKRFGMRSLAMVDVARMAGCL